MSEPSKNPPTARPGIKASQAQEHAQAVAADPKPEVSQKAVPPTEPETNVSSALNPPESQTPVAPIIDPASVVAFASEKKQVTGEAADDIVAEVSAHLATLREHWPQRWAFLLEAISSYRGVLHGLRTRLEFEIAHPQGINPDSTGAKGSLHSVLTGIENCTTLLTELGAPSETKPS